MQVKTIHCVQAPTRSGTPVTLAGGLISQRCATNGCLLTIHFFAIFSFNLRRQNLLRILNVLHDTCKIIYSYLEGQVVKWSNGPMTIHIVCRFFLQYFKTKLIMFSQTNILKSGRACGQMVHRWAAHGRPLTICGRETVTLQFHFLNKLFFG